MPSSRTSHPSCTLRCNVSLTQTNRSFESWLRVYNIDRQIPYTSPFKLFGPFGGSKATPLYCASLCGFHELVKSLVVKHPQHVGASCGLYLSPLVAALAHKHFRTA